MISILKKLFGLGPNINFKELIAQGALLIDVRTEPEFKKGHVKGAINMPLQTLNTQTSKLKESQIIITCCASGMRSSTAKNMLISKGFKHVHNGGSWMKLI